MSKEQKIEGFKIGDTHREGMSRPPAAVVPKKGAAPAQKQAFSVGFARIEALLDNEDPVEVGKQLNEILIALDELQKRGGSNKEKLAMRRAVAAVERAVDLMDYLYQTKAAMEAELVK